MYRDFLAILTGAIVAIMLLVSLHIALYPIIYPQTEPDGSRLPSRWDYIPWPSIVGCTALGIGMIVTSAMADQWFVAVAYWSLLIPGGLAIIFAWRVRRWLEHRQSVRRLYDYILQRGEEALRGGVPREPDDRRN